MRYISDSILLSVVVLLLKQSYLFIACFDHYGKECRELLLGDGSHFESRWLFLEFEVANPSELFNDKIASLGRLPFSSSSWFAIVVFDVYFEEGVDELIDGFVGVCGVDEAGMGIS
jgi:hypothetical protein